MKLSPRRPLHLIFCALSLHYDSALLAGVSTIPAARLRDAQRTLFGTRLR